MDVYTTVNVPFSTAVLGGEAKVHTLYGDVICKVREGTQSGSKIRLRGKGIVSMKNPQVHGDHYVTVQVQVPRNITRKPDANCVSLSRHVVSETAMQDKYENKSIKSDRKFYDMLISERITERL